MQNNIEKEIINRYKGCLVGAAVGDALGAPIEFFSQDQIYQQFPNGLREMVGGGYFKWAPGQTTDDTDMSMAIVNSVIENNGYVPQDIAKRFVGWMEGKPRDIGGMTQTGLLYIASGVDHNKSGQLTLRRFRTAPNGSIMRTAPMGLIFRGNEVMINQASDEVSAMTHAHPECLLACRMTSQMISDLASGAEKWEALDKLEDKFKNEALASKMINKALSGEFYRDVYPGGGYVFESFNIALYSFMGFDNFEDTVVYAANLGGDADSQATVAGAFAGAFYGIEEIPERWKKLLNPYSSSEIEEKAEILYHFSQSNKPRLRRFWDIISRSIP